MVAHLGLGLSKLSGFLVMHRLHVALQDWFGMKGHGTHVAWEPPLLMHCLMTPQKAFGWVVLLAGIALEPPTTVHLRNVTFQKPLIEKLFAENQVRPLTKYFFFCDLFHTWLSLVAKSKKSNKCHAFLRQIMSFQPRKTWIFLQEWPDLQISHFCARWLWYSRKWDLAFLWEACCITWSHSVHWALPTSTCLIALGALDIRQKYLWQIFSSSVLKELIPQ